MTEEQYITALMNNPHGIRNIPNPTEAMQLTCVGQNGMPVSYTHLDVYKRQWYR